MHLIVAQGIERPPVKVWILALISIPTSGPELVHQSVWYVLSCLWESVYTNPLLPAYQPMWHISFKEMCHIDQMLLLSNIQ